MSDPRDGEVVCESPACMRAGGTKLNREDRVCWRCGAEAFLQPQIVGNVWYVNTPDAVVPTPGGENLTEEYKAYKAVKTASSRRVADCPHCGQAAPAGAFKGHRECEGCGQCVLCPVLQAATLPTIIAHETSRYLEQFVVPAHLLRPRG